MFLNKMETAQPSKRKNRTKSTTSKSPTEAIETAPNLNGSKDGGTAEPEAASNPTSNDTQPEENTQNASKPMQGRKRKISEMKSDEVNEDLPPSVLEKEEPIKEIIEPEKIIEVKVEPGDIPVEAPTIEIKKEGITLPPKQTLGKGKRARIPNKRYSDILISPKLEKSRKFENGEVQDSSTEKENTINESTEPSNPTVTSLKTTKTTSSSPTGSLHKRQKVPVDLTNPNYLKPFQLGWKRELVYRATTDNTLKRNGDIYYYTPAGKKVRSMREVSENLKQKELSLEDFTFYKEPLGLDDPEKEIIRDAKIKSGFNSPKPSTPKITRTPKVASPKPPPPPATLSVTAPPASETPQKSKSTKTGSSFKVKFPNKTTTSKIKTEKKTSSKENDAEMEVGTYPQNWTTPAKTKTMTKWGNNLSENEEKQQPCSIRCENVWKPIPSLQCRYCLCLYHNECVGLSPLASVEAYVCKNCQLRQQPSAGSIQTLLPPPPLTPISTIKSTVTTSSITSPTVPILPKLQRIPKSQDAVTPTPVVKPLPPVPKPDLPKLIPRPNLATVPKCVTVNNISEQNAENKSLVGSVTTWFPPSSTIQVSSDRIRPDGESHSPPRPQFVEFLGNKKYLIVPKHNILSVSPTVASIHSKFEDFVTTPDLLNVGNDNVDEIVAEAAKIPPSPRISTEDIKLEPQSPININETTEIIEKNENNTSTEPMDTDTTSPLIPLKTDSIETEPEKEELIETVQKNSDPELKEEINNEGTIEDQVKDKDNEQIVPEDVPMTEETEKDDTQDSLEQENHFISRYIPVYPKIPVS